MPKTAYFIYYMTDKIFLVTAPQPASETPGPITPPKVEVQESPLTGMGSGN